ncbi:MAG: hypothetical protein ACRDH9_08780 [Actinomycetota bacterium]
MKMRGAIAAVCLVVAGAVPATAIPLGTGQGRSLVEYMPPNGIRSENVLYLGTIPENPGIGGRVVKVGNQTRFYMTGSQGLAIYDVTIPIAPILLGKLPLPHFQNEDVDVSDDGSRVIISVDTVGVSASPSGTFGNGIRIIDTTNPTLPTQVGFIGQSNHTTTCADPKCEWLYGSGGGLYDARNPASIVRVGNAPTGGHAFNRDASGLLVSDSNPRLVIDPRQDPSTPTVLASGSSKLNPDGLLQHNNVRPRAEQWVPREPTPPGEPPAPEFPLRPGELLIGNSESNVNPTCSNAGGLSTWSMVDFDKGAKLEQIEAFRPTNGTWADGNPAVNALGCSGHWFTVKGNQVAASWYEHGVKFFDVDPGTGHITQVGYYQPVVTEAGAAHWIGEFQGLDIVYNVDYARGIDILAFDDSLPAPSDRELYESWEWNLRNYERRGPGPASSLERYFCFRSGRALTVG